MIIAGHKSWLASIKGSYKSICEAYMRKTSDVEGLAFLAKKIGEKFGLKMA